MLIRAEEQKDWVAAHAVNVSAFGRPAEADLVDALRDQVQPIVSLIAEDNGALVGHIMFTPVCLSGNSTLKIMGLAPLAVAPEHQHKGVGSALVRAGLDQCRRLGFGAVVVLGHPDYYHVSGFGIGCEYAVAAGVFMVMEFQAGYLDGASGTIKYDTAFSDVEQIVGSERREGMRKEQRGKGKGVRICAARSTLTFDFFRDCHDL